MGFQRLAEDDGVKFLLLPIYALWKLLAMMPVGPEKAKIRFWGRVTLIARKFSLLAQVSLK
ncbi:hypothetical protein ACQP3J_31165, partial [Escherichia coli]